MLLRRVHGLSSTVIRVFSVIKSLGKRDFLAQLNIHSSRTYPCTNHDTPPELVGILHTYLAPISPSSPPTRLDSLCVRLRARRDPGRGHDDARRALRETARAGWHRFPRSREERAGIDAPHHHGRDHPGHRAARVRGGTRHPAGTDGGCAILGCTELPIVLGDHNAPFPTIDTTRLLAIRALEDAIKQANT